MRLSRQQEPAAELVSSAITGSAILLAKIVLLLLIVGGISRAFGSVHPVPLDRNTDSSTCAECQYR